MRPASFRVRSLRSVARVAKSANPKSGKPTSGNPGNSAANVEGGRGLFASLAGKGEDVEWGSVDANMLRAAITGAVYGGSSIMFAIDAKSGCFKIGVKVGDGWNFEACRTVVELEVACGAVTDFFAVRANHGKLTP